MFELSFGEILLLTMVALIVLGPERLPVVARFLGRMFAKMQHLVSNVKAELGAEMALDDFRKMRQELEQSAHSLREDLHQQAHQLQQLQQDAVATPYWDTLPPQRTPADFGIAVDDDMATERAWVAAEQASPHRPQSSLVKKSRVRRKNIRPYQPLSRRHTRLGARRQNRLNPHG